MLEALEEIYAIARKYRTSLKQGDVESDMAMIALIAKVAIETEKQNNGK